MSFDIAALQKSLHTLHLLYHRNKNQHRRAHWWKYLSLLKRNLQKIIAELETPNLRRTDARVRYMSEHLLPRCYVAFTQVVQDSQFCALGLVLVAELARVRKVLGCERRVSEGKGDVEAVEEGQGFVEASPGFDFDERGMEGIRSRPRDDVGEAVEREDPSMDASTTNAVPALEGKPVEAPTSLLSEPVAGRIENRSKFPPGAVKRQKKKVAKVKKGTSVIDDLFRDLT